MGDYRNVGVSESTGTSTSTVTRAEQEVHRPTAYRSDPSGFTVVRILLGILLIVAAGLKLLDRSPDPLARAGWIFSPHWHLAAIEAEAILGIWLLTGAVPRLLWLVALLCFCLFASVNLYLGIEGQPSCGCFGAKLAISPWYALVLDLAAVASLVWWRPRQGHRTEMPYLAMLPRGLAVAGGSGVILVAVFGGLTWIYGSLPETLLHLRAEPLTIEPSVTDLGVIPSGETRSFTVWLTNHSNHPIRIIGGTVDCSCNATTDLPLTVPRRQAREVTIHAEFRGRARVFQRPFVLYAEDTSQPTVAGVVKGHVVESPEP
jgi:hypothetical protein